MFQPVDFKDTIYNKSNPIFQTDIWNKSIPWFTKTDEIKYSLEPFPPLFKINTSDIKPNMEIPNLITGIQNIENYSHLGLLGSSPNFSVATKKVNNSVNPHYIMALQAAPLLPVPNLYNNVKNLLDYIDMKDASFTVPTKRVYFDTRDQKEAYYINMKKDLPKMYDAEKKFKHEIDKIDEFLDAQQLHIVELNEEKNNKIVDNISTLNFDWVRIWKEKPAKIGTALDALTYNNYKIEKIYEKMKEKLNDKIRTDDPSRLDQLTIDINNMNHALNEATQKFYNAKQKIEGFYENSYGSQVRQNEREISMFDREIKERKESIFEMTNLLEVKRQGLKDLQREIKLTENSDIRNIQTIGGINALKIHEPIQDHPDVFTSTDNNATMINKKLIELPFNLYFFKLDEQIFKYQLFYNSKWEGLSVSITIPNVTNNIVFPGRDSCVQLFTTYIKSYKYSDDTLPTYVYTILQYISTVSILNEILEHNSIDNTYTIFNKLLICAFISFLRPLDLRIQELQLVIDSDHDALQTMSVDIKASYNKALTDKQLTALETFRPLVKQTFAYFITYPLLEPDLTAKLKNIFTNKDIVSEFKYQQDNYKKENDETFNNIKNYLSSLNGILVRIDTKQVKYDTSYLTVVQDFLKTIDTFIDTFNFNLMICVANINFFEEIQRSGPYSTFEADSSLEVVNFLSNSTNFDGKIDMKSLNFLQRSNMDIKSITFDE